MGFKADTSFLRFLSMGAVGVHRTMDRLRDRGFELIELERYSGSNKIWTTKVKRLSRPGPHRRRPAPRTGGIRSSPHHCFR